MNWYMRTLRVLRFSQWFFIQGPFLVLAFLTLDFSSLTITSVTSLNLYFLQGTLSPFYLKCYQYLMLQHNFSNLSRQSFCSQVYLVRLVRLIYFSLELVLSVPPDFLLVYLWAYSFRLDYSLHQLAFLIPSLYDSTLQ